MCSLLRELLNSSLDGHKWSASRPGQFTREEEPRYTF